MTVDEHRKNIAVAVRNLNEAFRLASHDEVEVSADCQTAVFQSNGTRYPVIYATISLPC